VVCDSGDVDDQGGQPSGREPRHRLRAVAPALLACVVGLVGAWLGLALLARETVPIGPFRVELDVGFGRGETVLGLPPFGALTAEAAPEARHVRAVDVPRVGGSIEARVLTQIAGGALVEVLEVTFPVGQVRSASPHPAGVTEHLLLTDGRLRAGPVHALTDLAPGDVLRFAGDVAHQYAAIGDQPARAIVLMAYPSA